MKNVRRSTVSFKSYKRNYENMKVYDRDRNIVKHINVEIYNYENKDWNKCIVEQLDSNYICLENGNFTNIEASISLNKCDFMEEIRKGEYKKVDE